MSYCRASGALLVTAVMIGSTAAAFGADASPPVSTAYNWTGFYAGGHAGYGGGKTTWTNPGVVVTDYRTHGVLGGGQVGLNYQIGSAVIGIEGSLSGGSIKGSGYDVWGDSLDTKINWIGAVTGRLGFAFDRALLYGKGGVAWTQDRFSILTPAGRSAETKQSRSGSVWGVGIEYALNKDWSVKLEYEHIAFGTHHVTFATGDFADVEQKVDRAMIGLNYLFNR